MSKKERAMQPFSKKSTEAVRVLLDEYEQLLSGTAPSTRVTSLRILRHLIEWVTQHSANAGPFQPEMLTQAAGQSARASFSPSGVDLRQRRTWTTTPPILSRLMAPAS